MENDLFMLIGGMSLLVIYLIFSAMTEMGTKWPWKK
jgi:hypothetical protein